MAHFDKYQRGGAYHWQQTHPQSKDKVYNPLLIARYRALASLIPRQATTILDLGCGDGYLIHLSANSSSRCTFGIDDNNTGVWLAQQELSKRANRSSRHLSVGSITCLCFPDKAFEVALMADVIEHLARPDQTLAETRRVLTDSGIFLLSTPNWQPDRTWDKLHVQEFTPEALEELLRDYFAQVQIRACWPMWWFKQWQRKGRQRRLVNLLCRLGYNPFVKMTRQPALGYGQLIAICRK